MIKPFKMSFKNAAVATALILIGNLAICLPCQAQLNCVTAVSSGSTTCQDAGGVASTCASVKCPAGLTLTGVGGACAAGGIRLKSIIPHVDTATAAIMCEKQGVDPQAVAVCCRLQ
jgi:hypothetical protein